MSYDAALAERVRRRLGQRPDLSEQQMSGGLAFLIGGRIVDPRPWSLALGAST